MEGLDLKLIDQFLQRSFSLEKTNIELAERINYQSERFLELSKSIDRVCNQSALIRESVTGHGADIKILETRIKNAGEKIDGHISSHWQWFAALVALIPGLQWLIVHLKKQ